MTTAAKARRTLTCGILACLLGLVLVIGVCGCSSGPAPESVVKQFFDAVKQADLETANSLCVVQNTQVPATDTPEWGIVKAFLGRLNYEVVSSETKGSEAVVNVKISTPDFMQVVSRVISQALPLAAAGGSAADAQAMVFQLFADSLKDPNLPMIETPVAIEMTKTGGKWLIAANPDLGPALLGNMNQMDQLFNQGQ